ncbi:hypothetical protein [Streptomyces natalensis]|uniref:hypothetical protein n=1 Tax=Streptomyces natalensis TaxID=68242 RepID=UPI000A47F103|nr:hypothetical protein [Streptomyces natalensis]
MAVQDRSGLFLVLEGADGSGKSAVVGELISLAENEGIPMHRILRESPRGHQSYANLIRAVGGLFKDGDELEVQWDLLSLAAAAQYLALLQSEVEEIVLGGGVVVAESWWHKTRVRMAIEASIRQQHNLVQAEKFRNWQRDLMPVSRRLGPHQQMTVLLEADMEDRIHWYQNGGCIEPVYDSQGAVSHDATHFGTFTQQIANELRLNAQAEDWPVVLNSSKDKPVCTAGKVLKLVEAHLRARAVC